MKLYALDISEISADDISLVRNAFPGRFERASRRAANEDRLAVIAGGLLLYHALGIRDESLIRTASGGKPYVQDGPAFSLSHSGGRCLLAAGEGLIGADLEKLDEGNLIAAEVSLTEKELAWISPSPCERFHILWTRKESLFKAAGGFRDPKEIEVLDESLPKGIFMESFLDGGFAVSLCSDREIGLVRPEKINKLF